MQSPLISEVGLFAPEDFFAQGSDNVLSAEPLKA